MAVPTGPVTEVDLARLRDKFDAMKRSESATRWTSRLVTLAIAIVAVVGVWLLLQPFYTAYKQPEPYQRAFEREMKESILPALQEEAVTMYKEVGPEVQKVAVQKFNDRMPEISTTLQGEAQTLVANLSASAQEYQARLPELEQKIYSRIVAHAPELANQDATNAMARNANEAVNNAVSRILVEDFEDHAVAANQFGETLRAFPVSGGIKKLTDEELREHLKNTLASYAAYQFDASLSPQLKQFALGYSEMPHGTPGNSPTTNSATND